MSDTGSESGEPPAKRDKPTSEALPADQASPLTKEDLTTWMRLMLKFPPQLPTQSSAPVTSSGGGEANFRLVDLDPDRGDYSVNEWCNDATQTKTELGISDRWMLVKAGEAMKGSARCFYNGWKPRSKTWDNFITDLQVAFPDGKTWYQQLQKAINCCSNQYKTLREYGTDKIRFIKAFHDDLPWEKVLSWVEGDLVEASIREFVHTRCPQNENELLRALVYFQPNSDSAVQDTSVSRPQPVRHGFKKIPTRFAGKCFSCDKPGHRASECRQAGRVNKAAEVRSAPKEDEVVNSCSHCGRKGHLEATCWQKHGRPVRTAWLQGARPLVPLLATTSNNKDTKTFRYIIDSGSEVSIMHQTVADQLGLKQTTNSHAIRGIGIGLVSSFSSCEVLVAMERITVEVEFYIVPDKTIPGENVDALIGWDVISRDGIETVVGNSGLELQYSIGSCPKISSVNCAVFELPMIKSGLDERGTDRLRILLQQYQKLTPAVVTTGKLSIKLRDSTPVVYRPRRLAYSERDQVKKMVCKMMNEGIIRESFSSYASPIVLVKKKSGDLRLCVDFRDLNKRVEKERYPLPLIHDQIDALATAKYFTTLDMKDGFYQVEIEESSRHLTAFVTPDGLFEFVRMPFGFVNSPACYQRAIDRAIGSLKGSIAFVYLDDVLVVSRTIDEGFENLNKVLNALAVAGFSLNYNKCQFFQTDIEYLGVLISAGTVRPSTYKLDALKKTLPPTDVKGVRQFMGLAGYFRRFIKKFSIITAPITSLLRKDASFVWLPECESIRRSLIEKLTSQPILRIFDPSLPTELHTDASSVGIGAVLMQKQNEISRPVAYFSRKTNNCESKYHSYDLETLAIVDATQHFRVYLYGIHFTVVTDCNSVRATALKKELHPRVARWWIKLQNFDFSVEYRAGTKMQHVDYLSRNPVLSVRSCRIGDSDEPLTVLKAQEMDDFCKQIMAGSIIDDTMTIRDKLVYKKIPLKGGQIIDRCFVPVCARLYTMKLFHDESSHIGWEKGIRKLRETLWWPRMGPCFRKYISNCRACIIGKSHTGRKAGKMQVNNKPTKPFQTWHIDHAGPLLKSKGNTQILVVIDGFSKFCKFMPVTRKSADAAIEALHNIFVTLGKPNGIIGDRGTAFSSLGFQTFCKDQDVDLHLIATGMCRGNGQVERVMRTLFNLLRATLNDKDEHKWVDVLAGIESDINDTVSEATGVTPRELMFREHNQLESTKFFLKGVVTNTDTVDHDALLAKVNSKLQNQREQDKLRFDVKRYMPVLFKEGDEVVVADSQLAGKGKLGDKFKGPYKVKKVLPNERYELHKTGARTTVAAHEQLRRWPGKDESALVNCGFKGARAPQGSGWPC